MALGGVDTGIMNPSDVDSASPTATGIGLNPSDRAVVIAIGPIRLVDAVFDVNSVSKRVKAQKTARNIISDGLDPIILLRQLPIQLDRPVVYISAPIDKPPPKSSSVLQSIPATPSFHFNVISPFLRFTGRKKSSNPPTRATMCSGKTLLNAFTIAASGP